MRLKWKRDGSKLISGDLEIHRIFWEGSTLYELREICVLIGAFECSDDAKSAAETL